MATGFLKNKVLYSPLASQSMIRPSGPRGRRRNLSATLLLTSLVDAFSILVIFLMMNSATEQSDFELKEAVRLPKATQGQTSVKSATVHITKEKIQIDGRVVGSQNLAVALEALHKRLIADKNPTPDSLIIIADRDEDFMTLNPIIVAGSRVGFSEFKFAIERGN